MITRQTTQLLEEASAALTWHYENPHPEDALGIRQKGDASLARKLSVAARPFGLGEDPLSFESLNTPMTDFSKVQLGTINHVDPKTGKGPRLMGHILEATFTDSVSFPIKALQEATNEVCIGLDLTRIQAIHILQRLDGFIAKTMASMPEAANVVEALQAVEDWWMSDANSEHRAGGAPACIFMVREALSKIKGV